MELQKDLQSLKLLYKVLQTTGNDMDEGACLLFKNLLDSTRDTLLTTSKIIATGISMSSNSSNAIHSNIHTHEQSIRKPFSSRAVSEQNRKKRCRVCQQSNLQRRTKDDSRDESTNDFSKQVADSIKLIESTILSLRLSSVLSNPIKLQSQEEAAALTSRRTWAENSPSFLILSQRIESPAYHYVHGLRIPSIQDNDGTNTVDPSRKTFRNDSLTLQDKNIGMLEKRRQSIRTQLDCASTAYSHNQNLMKPMLLDYESFTRKPCVRQRQKITIPSRRQSDVSSSSSQGSDVNSAVSSPTSSYSSRSQPETEASAMTPETSAEDSSSSSVNSSESYKNTGGSSRKMHKENPDKAIGQLRRLKNKLGLIFHHHHHHHHHHHRENETNNAKDHKRSAWKHLGMIFHHKDKERICEKQAVRKLKKLPVSKKQAGQFQELVKGMVRHVKKSKKPKVAKGGIRTHHDNRHWWQLFHGGRRRRGVKLPNGVRLQVRGKKPQLRAPKIAK